eukprot:TRINITY_DN7515_c1_g2_i1.p1 TRINITY_DN7515_c1_g2~~TRINITY_DN7515_c1_g2_i1.p1  ORF type:complete len:202 (-),score=-20.53 TRINITY_DN7515_c1_g2_i1:25-630(-)
MIESYQYQTIFQKPYIYFLKKYVRICIHVHINFLQYKRFVLTIFTEYAFILKFYIEQNFPLRGIIPLRIQFSYIYNGISIEGYNIQLIFFVHTRTSQIQPFEDAQICRKYMRACAVRISSRNTHMIKRQTIITLALRIRILCYTQVTQCSCPYPTSMRVLNVLKDAQYGSNENAINLLINRISIVTHFKALNSVDGFHVTN